MRRTLSLSLVLGLATVFPMGSRAADDAAAIVEKAMKAHFPKGLDDKNQGVSTKSKGTVHVMGLDIDFDQQILVKMPNKFKETSEMTVMNVKVQVTSVFNGKEAWIRANDKDVEVSDDILGEFKDAVYTLSLMQGLFVKDKAVKLSLVGEMKFKDKTLIGVNISREGKKDVNMYFDKATNLITKIDARKKDITTGQEVSEERIITEYQEADGRKVAKKVEILRDGKAYMELEVLEVTNLEKIDDSEFAKPK
jgi:hypothetical protein